MAVLKRIGVVSAAKILAAMRKTGTCKNVLFNEI